MTPILKTDLIAVAVLTAGLSLLAIGEAIRRWDDRQCAFANLTDTEDEPC